MTLQLINDKREFTWLSSDTKPTLAPHAHGAKGLTKDTGERWIYDKDERQWIEDLSLIYAISQADTV